MGCTCVQMCADVHLVYLRVRVPVFIFAASVVQTVSVSPSLRVCVMPKWKRQSRHKNSRSYKRFRSQTRTPPAGSWFSLSPAASTASARCPPQCVEMHVGSYIPAPSQGNAQKMTRMRTYISLHLLLWPKMSIFEQFPTHMNSQ